MKKVRVRLDEMGTPAPSSSPSDVMRAPPLTVPCNGQVFRRAIRVRGRYSMQWDGMSAQLPIPSVYAAARGQTVMHDFAGMQPYKVNIELCFICRD